MTYHGPGQRVGLCDARSQAPRAGRAPLRRHAGRMDHPHACRLQRARRAARGSHRRLGTRPDKGEGHEDKIAAIGIRVTQWVTLHGIAINVEPDLRAFCRHRALRRGGASVTASQAWLISAAGHDGRCRHGAAAASSKRCSAPDRISSVGSTRTISRAARRHLG